MTVPAAPGTRLPVAGGWHVALTYDVAGQPAVVVLGYVADANANAAAGATVLAQRFHDNARPIMSSSATITGITAHAADGSGNALAVPLPVSNRTGMAGGALVTAYATLLKWTTTQGGRTGRGRTFVPGFTVASLAVDGRSLTTAALASAATLGASLTGTGGVPGFSVLSHRAGVGYGITGYSVGTLVGIQRRRIRN